MILYHVYKDPDYEADCTIVMNHANMEDIEKMEKDTKLRVVSVTQEVGRDGSYTVTLHQFGLTNVVDVVHYMGNYVYTSYCSAPLEPTGTIGELPYDNYVRPVKIMQAHFIKDKPGLINVSLMDMNKKALDVLKHCIVAVGMYDMENEQYSLSVRLETEGPSAWAAMKKIGEMLCFT